MNSSTSTVSATTSATPHSTTTDVIASSVNPSTQTISSGTQLGVGATELELSSPKVPLRPLHSIGYLASPVAGGAPVHASSASCWERCIGDTVGVKANQCVTTSNIEVRPPVLGEEEKIIGGEEDGGVDQETLLLQGDGWGECPAVEDSPPEECFGGVMEEAGCNINNPMEWSRSLQNLLQDTAGIATFTKFLVEDYGSSYSLDFFFACKGLSKMSVDDLPQLLNHIWKKFVRGYSVPVTAETHAALAERIHQNKLTADMFQIAQQEVWQHMSEKTYPSFLQSEQYVSKVDQYRYLQSLGGSRHELMQETKDLYCGQQHTIDMSSTSSVGLHEALGFKRPSKLSTLYEHETADVNHSSLPASAGASMSHTNTLTSVNPILDSFHYGINNSKGGMWDYSSNVKGMCGSPMSQGAAAEAVRLTQDSLAATAWYRAKPINKTGIYRNGVNPYHAMYGKGHFVSRQDSEGRSFSSGTHTDDTWSYTTDGSIDSCLGSRGGSSKRRQKGIMRENLRLNEELRRSEQQQQLVSPGGSGMRYTDMVIPRTMQPINSDSKLAENPPEFAKVLSERLERVKRERDSHEKMHHAFKKIQESEGRSTDMYRTEHALSSLPPELLINKLKEKLPLDDEQLDASGQAILDEHVSRVWQDSSRTSPVHSSITPPQHLHHHRLQYPPPVSTSVAASTPAPHSLSAVSSTLAMSSEAAHPPTKNSTHPKNKNYVSSAGSLGGQGTAIGVNKSMYYAGSTSSINTDQSRGHHLNRQHHHHRGPDAYSTFSSDSGNVADYSESSQRHGSRNGRSMSSGVPKTRSMPEHIMHPCGGMRHSGPGRSGVIAGGPGGAEMTDSGVSVISDSQKSLMKQKVEHWLHESSSDSKDSNRRTATSIDARYSQRRSSPGRRGNSMGPPSLSDTRADSRRQRSIQQQHMTGSYPAEYSNSGRSSAAAMSSSGLSYGNIIQATIVQQHSSSPNTGPGLNNNTNAQHKHSTSSNKGTNSIARPHQNNSGGGGGGGSDTQSSTCGGRSDGEYSTTVVYSFCDDSVPFVIKIPARCITLRRFKHHLPKRGNYRFFFKKHCEEFGVIQEEMTEEEELLPLFEGKIFAQIRKCD